MSLLGLVALLTAMIWEMDVFRYWEYLGGGMGETTSANVPGWSQSVHDTTGVLSSTYLYYMMSS